MKIRGQTVTGWQDFLELGVASWLFISPFVLGFIAETSASLSAMLLSSVAILFSILGLSTRRLGDEWGNEMVAIGLIASPWLFGYAHVEIAVLNAVSCGILLAFLAALAMMEERAEMKKVKNI